MLTVLFLFFFREKNTLNFTVMTTKNVTSKTITMVKGSVSNTPINLAATKLKITLNMESENETCPKQKSAIDAIMNTIVVIFANVVGIGI